MRALALLDSGADISAISNRLAKRLQLKASGRDTIETITGKKENVDLVSAKLHFGKTHKFMNFAVMDISDDIIIGHPEMQYNQMTLDFKNDKIKFKTEKNRPKRLRGVLRI